MDNDELRRGKPTCHKQYGETTAILVGDALLTQAFEIMSRNIQDAQTASLRLKACFELAHAAGAYGMVGGQALDMALKDTKPSFEELERCHLAKTAALFSASTTIGALAGGADEQQVTMLRDYGRNFGLAFQHADDLKDGEFTMHLERAYQRALELAERAKNTANHFGDRGAPLVALAEWVAERAREAKFHATPK
jgi:geranylgeranyl pyrophosphate synthase